MRAAWLPLQARLDLRAAAAGSSPKEKEKKQKKTLKISFIEIV